MSEPTTIAIEADLHDRAVAVRRSLALSNQEQRCVLPVIATAKTREEIEPDMEDAEKLGIYVLTCAELLELVESTMRVPDAEAYFEQAEREVRFAQQRHSISDQTSWQMSILPCPQN